MHDRDTGLVRFGYRDYDPDIGRWTAKDPISFAGEDTDLYGYVLNNPVNRVDPHGLFWNPFGNLPSISDAFPNSQTIAPIADIAIGGIEAGISVVAGIGGAILLTQPELWPIAAPLLPVSIETGIDAYGRIMSGIENLSDNCP